MASTSARPRIAVGGIEHETAGMLPGETSIDVFRERHVTPEEMLLRSGEANTVVDGYLAGARRQGWEVVPLGWVKGTSGPPASQQTFVTLLSELLVELRAAAPVDGVLLSLHGSFAVEGVDDADGAVLAAVRDVIGPGCPLLAVHDMHCNLTGAMVEPADFLVVMRTYPHVDMHERALHAVDRLSDILVGKLNPTMAWRQLPLLWSAPCMISGQSPMSEVVKELEQLDEHPDVVSCSLGVGYQWIDSPAVGASTVVVTNGDLPSAQQQADRLAAWAWENREKWVCDSISAAEGLDAGERTGKYPVILADQSDNTGGGAPGDSTEVLRLFVERGLEDAAVLYMVDPTAAAAAHRAGAGATVNLEVGGHSDAALGPPVSMQAEVVAISDGRFVYDGPMWRGVEDDLGPTAWIREGGVSVVLISQRQQPIDLSLCRSLGMVCERMRYLSIKSTGHFRSGFESIAGSIWNVDAVGLLSQDFRRLPYTRLGRPVYPRDLDVPRGW